jgi:chemotaxis protein CheD
VAVNEIRVRVADLAVGRAGDVITTVGLGSCVAIVLHDARARVGGLAHILLPSEAVSRETGNQAKFPGTAVPLLLEQMAALGAGRGVTAKIVGGASMFTALLSSTGVNMGDRNVDATVRALEAAQIPLVARDTGGDYGRSVSLDVSTGRVDVRSLRRGNIAL